MPEAPALLGPADAVTCPADGHTFRPYYTAAACPLCGWPVEAAVARPWTHRVDWVWIAFAGLVLVSAMMAFVVFAAL